LVVTAGQVDDLPARTFDADARDPIPIALQRHHRWPRPGGALAMARDRGSRLQRSELRFNLGTRLSLERRRGRGLAARTRGRPGRGRVRIERNEGIVRGALAHAQALAFFAERIFSITVMRRLLSSSGWD
jgi:hypothetical protein